MTLENVSADWVLTGYDRTATSVVATGLSVTSYLWLDDVGATLNGAVIGRLNVRSSDLDIASFSTEAAYVSDSAMTATDGVVTGNVDWWAVSLDGSTGTFTNTQVIGHFGGPALHVAWASTLSLVDSLVADTAGFHPYFPGGGAEVVGASTLTCSKVAAPVAGFLRNSASEGGAVLVESGSTLVSGGCDWGTGAYDNSPDDVFLEDAIPAAHAFGNGATFTCVAGPGGSCS